MPTALGVFIVGKQPQVSEGLTGARAGKQGPRESQSVDGEPRCPRSQEQVGEGGERGVSPEPLLTAAGQDDHGEEFLHTQAGPERGEHPSPEPVPSRLPQLPSEAPTMSSPRAPAPAAAGLG